MKISGVYQILNKVNNKSYIGSSINIHARWARHICDLNNNVHHSLYLQRAWNKYGKDSFIFTILEERDKEDLIKREDYFFSFYRPEYNICPTAKNALGMKHTKESSDKKRAYALANNVKPPPPKTKKVTKLDYITSEELVTYNSISEACFSVGRDYNFVTTISDVCNGKRKSAFKFKWKWAIIEQ